MFNLIWFPLIPLCIFWHSPTFSSPIKQNLLNSKQAACATYPKAYELIKPYVEGAKHAFKALPLNPSDKDSIWDLSYLKDHPELLQALNEFLNNQRAQSLKKIKLNGLTAQQIYFLLKEKGFSYKRQCLTVNREGKVYTIQKNGMLILRKLNIKQCIPHDFYLHNDGGLIRVKPKGYPTPFVKKRTHPQATKSVLLKLCKTDSCIPDLSFENEAFKVTDEDYVLPKQASTQSGLKKAILHSQYDLEPFQNAYKEGWINAIMSSGHALLSVEYDCPKANHAYN